MKLYVLMTTNKDNEIDCTGVFRTYREAQDALSVDVKETQEYFSDLVLEIDNSDSGFVTMTLDGNEIVWAIEEKELD